MQVLVVGGAGFIGSHMAKRLVRAGCGVVVLDNLSSGHRDAVVEGAELVQADLGDAQALATLFSARRFQAVMHFASHIQVGESVRDPARYYANNVANTLVLLQSMLRHAVRRFVFSSTAAVYGDPEYSPLDEAHPKRPINPYGRSKWMVEQILADYGHAYGLKSMSLRYFNAAGADPEGQLGERHHPETHLVPLLLQAAAGRRESVTIFGRDYDTPDGTCVRDYVHVADLADAHLLALERLLEGGDSAAYNLGTGRGFSVQEVVEAVGRVTGHTVPVVYGARRDGDPPRLVAEASRARAELGWRPHHDDLDVLIRHAWHWEMRRGG